MRRRWIWILVSVPLIAGLVRLRFDADIFNLLPANLPAVRGLRIQQQNFANARELLITLQAEDPEIASAAARAIADQLATKTNLIRSARWQPPWLDRRGMMRRISAGFCL
jgi:predicted RND superfamily exporter protein